MLGRGRQGGNRQTWQRMRADSARCRGACHLGRASWRGLRHFARLIERDSRPGPRCSRTTASPHARVLPRGLSKCPTRAPNRTPGWRRSRARRSAWVCRRPPRHGAGAARDGGPRGRVPGLGCRGKLARVHLAARDRQDRARSPGAACRDARAAHAGWCPRTAEVDAEDVTYPAMVKPLRSELFTEGRLRRYEAKRAWSRSAS